ncbi:MAG: flippase-like domain-containing protein [Acidobacteria bacterium]|nr:flippase-like domain-containing protein [Acidobacteriota bacterium]
MDRLAMTRSKAALWGAITATIAAVALWAALRGMEWTSFRSQLRSLDWRWLALAVFFDIASYAAQGLRWRYLLNGARLWQTTRAIYAGLFCNEVVPLRPGEAVRAWLASRDLRVSILSIAPTILAERLMDGIWLAAALLAALAIAPLPAQLVHIVWIVAGTVVLLVAAALLIGRARLPALPQALRNSPALAISGCFLLTQGLAFWAVGRASHLSLNIAAAFVVMLVVRIGTMIPGAPANLGTHQFSTVLGLSLYGIPQAAAAAYALVVFVVLTVPLLAIGFFACMHAGLNWQSIRTLFGCIPPPRGCI